MLKLIINSISYKDCFLSAEWSGNIKSSARKLQIDFLKGKIKVAIGDKVEFYVNNKLIFKGMVYRFETTTSNTQESFTCFDNGIRLNKNSFVKNYYQQLPSEIVKSILGELNLEVGVVPLDSVKCDFPAWNRSAYEIILMAYKIQSNKDKKIYSIVDNLGKIEIIEQGTLIKSSYLSTSENIVSASYSQSIEELVNKVVMYEMKENKPNISGTKENSEDLKKYGVFQQVQEQDKTNVDYLQVQNSLKSMEETASVRCLGDIEFESGYSVPVKISNISKVNGIFLIESDVHVWSANSYYCDLELTFENVMNDIEVATYPVEKTKKEKKI
ncbi:MAG: XkdQ/YqbQ family protein [Fusobacteriaceae bacterium]